MKNGANHIICVSLPNDLSYYIHTVHVSSIFLLSRTRNSEPLSRDIAFVIIRVHKFGAYHRKYSCIWENINGIVLHKFKMAISTSPSSLKLLIFFFPFNHARMAAFQNSLSVLIISNTDYRFSRLYFQWRNAFWHTVNNKKMLLILSDVFRGKSRLDNGGKFRN